MEKPAGISQTHKALLELRGRIVNGRLNGGEKLGEVKLAEDMGISRTPLREALLQLEQEGLLVRGKGGYTVRSFSLEDVFDAIELRGVLEGTAARMAAERGVDEQALTEIKNTVAQLDRVQGQNKIADYDRLNTLFHDQLASLCGSSIVRDEVERASRFPFAAPSAFPASMEDSEQFLASLTIGQQQHHDLIEAIENRQGGRAENIAREHARLARRNVENAHLRREQNTMRIPQLALVKG